MSQLSALYPSVHSATAWEPGHVVQTRCQSDVKNDAPRLEAHKSVKSGPTLRRAVSGLKFTPLDHKLRQQRLAAFAAQCWQHS